MKVKVLLALLLFITSININAQEKNSDCNFEYAVEVKMDENSIYSAVFNWDISKIKDLATEITIEILPIKDCFNEEKATRFRETFLIDLKSNELSGKKLVETNLKQLASKCFNWRVIIKSDDCVEKSDWNYYSFL